MAASDLARRHPRWALYGVLLLLSGCSLLPVSSDPAQRIDAALSEHRYAAALAIIDSTEATQPNYPALQARRGEIVQASRRYRGEVLRQARRLADDEQWEDAYALLVRAAPLVLESEPIDTLGEQLKEQEAAALRERLTRWYLALGQALLSSGRVDQALAPFHVPEAEMATAEWHRLRHRTTAALTELGHFYADQRQWEAASRTLEMAQQLSPERPLPQALTLARQAIDSARNQQQTARENAHRKTAQELVARYQDSESLDDLLAARTFLLRYPGPDLAPLRQRVERWCQQRLADAMARGEALYARGEYRTAYRLWQQVAPLEPDNAELNSKLERSRRVLENLRTLDE